MKYESLQMAGLRPRHVSEISGLGEPVSLREPLRALGEGEEIFFILQLCFGTPASELAALCARSVPWDERPHLWGI